MKKVFWVYLILTVFLMVSIFYFSAQPGEKSSAVSENVTKKVVTEEKIAHLPHKEADKQFETVETIIRKSAHFIIFSGLGFCIFMTFYHSGKMHKIYIICILSLIFCILYAVSDEVHQLFISERSGEVRDVLIDSSGSFLGILLVLFICKIKSKYKKR